FLRSRFPLLATPISATYLLSLHDALPILAAYFQSIRLALVSVAAVPATLCGVGLTLLATGTTLNLQSFMGAIMALGVSVANAILDRKSTRLNSSHEWISYAVFCLKKKKTT